MSPSRFLVGPVLSRRIGRSLGVDLLRGECTFLCPYCEVRVRHVDKLKLFPFKNTAALFSEYKTFCASHGPHDLDSVTFSGTGEPTLISNLGSILRTFKSIAPFPLTVITNGSLLWIPAVRKNLRPADLVVPSLDAVTESAWRRVNRPHPELTLKKYLSGMEQFCAAHPGKIWLEVLIMRGVNDKDEDIAALGNFVRRLKLDKIQIGTVDRPPARSRARPIPNSKLNAIVRQVASISGQQVESMSRPSPYRVSPPPRRDSSLGDLTEKIIQSVRLRPQTPSELKRLLSIPDSLFQKTLRSLESSGRLIRTRFGRQTFVQATITQ